MVQAADSAGVRLMEAFMYRLHPLWVEVRRLLSERAIGDLLAVQVFFSYYNVNPEDIRNIADVGGALSWTSGATRSTPPGCCSAPSRPGSVG